MKNKNAREATYLRTCALLLLHYYYLPLLVLLLVRFDLVGVIVFAFTPIFAFEALC